ncbi:MAG: HepT-like ribonuclease domain-containing protein [Bauldia sp.]
MRPDRRPEQRAKDIKDYIRNIRDLLDGRSLNEIGRDTMKRAALERFLEVISEASRHLPKAWKDDHAQIPWQRIADIGNVLRHAYTAVDLSILWGIYERDLSALEVAVDAMLATYATKDDRP